MLLLKKLIKNPSSVELAKEDLEIAKRELLAMQSQAEHSAKMVEYYKGVIKRLSEYLKTETA